MSFGFGVGDFIAVGQLALKLYNACANAPGEFQDLRRDLSSIHTVLYGLQAQADDPESLLCRCCSDRKPEWIRLRQNLEETLLELQDLVKRYEKMGRNAWLRVQLGLNNLSDLRGKLSIHLNTINVFVGSLTLSTLGRMEPTLGRIELLLLEFVKEERLGHKAPTVLSAHESGDGPAWRQMKLDLLLGGISKEDLERNEDRIRDLLDWVVNNEHDLVALQDVEVGDSISQQDSSDGEEFVHETQSQFLNGEIKYENNLNSKAAATMRAKSLSHARRGSIQARRATQEETREAKVPESSETSGEGIFPGADLEISRAETLEIAQREAKQEDDATERAKNQVERGAMLQEMKRQIPPSAAGKSEEFMLAIHSLTKATDSSPSTSKIEIDGYVRNIRILINQKACNGKDVVAFMIERLAQPNPTVQLRTLKLARELSDPFSETTIREDVNSKDFTQAIIRLLRDEKTDDQVLESLRLWRGRVPDGVYSRARDGRLKKQRNQGPIIEPNTQTMDNDFPGTTVTVNSLLKSPSTPRSQSLPAPEPANSRASWLEVLETATDDNPLITPLKRDECIKQIHNMILYKHCNEHEVVSFLIKRLALPNPNIQLNTLDVLKMLEGVKHISYPNFRKEICTESFRQAMRDLVEDITTDYEVLERLKTWILEIHWRQDYDVGDLLEELNKAIISLEETGFQNHLKKPEPEIVTIKIAVIDYDLTHFGVMFQKYLKIFSKEGRFGPWRTHQNWRPKYEIDIFGSKPALSSHAAAQKNDDKMKAILGAREGISWNTRLYRYSSDFPLSINTLRSYAYDFVLFVPLSYGRNQEHGLATYFGIPKPGNFIDILSLPRFLSKEDLANARKELALLYSQSKFTIRTEFYYYSKARHQVLSCTVGFMVQELNFVVSQSIWDKLDE